MNRFETEEVLRAFVNNVIADSKADLQSKNASGKLSDSLKGNVEIFENSISTTIDAEDYWEYVDQGVSGIKKKYNTPFSYRSKGGKTGLKGMPPPSAFDNWNIRRGRAGRNEKGQFLNRKQLNFATAVGVFYYGIEPTHFLTGNFDLAFQTLPDEVVEAYGLDLEKFIEFTLKTDK